MKNLRDNFWINYMISEYHVLTCYIMPKLVPDEKAVVQYYKKKSNGKIIDFNHLNTFSEKLQWYKLNAKEPLMEVAADKYAVREYISDSGYSHLLNDIYGVYTKVSDIDFEGLPQSYVIKATHGSGWNLIVKDKETLNLWQSKLQLKSWLKQDTSWSGREWVYKNMPRRLIIEKYLEDETGELRDYKFFCFNGEPRFMQLEVGRATKNNTRNFYDMNWELMPFGKEFPHNPDINVPKPKLFEDMKKIATDLCQPFQFVRVDLYQAFDKVYFGELTFFPAGGTPDFVPSDYDKIVGDMWQLETK